MPEPDVRLFVGNNRFVIGVEIVLRNKDISAKRKSWNVVIYNPYANSVQYCLSGFAEKQQNRTDTVNEHQEWYENAWKVDEDDYYLNWYRNRLHRFRSWHSRLKDCRYFSCWHRFLNGWTWKIGSRLTWILGCIGFGTYRNGIINELNNIINSTIRLSWKKVSFRISTVKAR